MKSFSISVFAFSTMHLALSISLEAYRERW